MVLGDSTPESLTRSVNVPLGWDIYHGYNQPGKNLDFFNHGNNVGAGSPKAYYSPQNAWNQDYVGFLETQEKVI